VKLKTKQRLADWRIEAFDIWMAPAVLWAFIGARLFRCNVQIALDVDEPDE